MISKKDAAAAVARNNEAEIKRIEQQLDRMIACYGSAVVDAGRPAPGVLAEIRHMYEAGGWTVEFDENTRDQRDGVMIKLV